MRSAISDQRSAISEFLFAVLIFSLCPSLVHADLPLTVESLLSDKGKARFDFSISYNNSERKGVSVADMINLQTGENSFVSIPARIGENTSLLDAFVGTASIRYGLTNDLEVYARSSGLYIDRRSETLAGSNLSSSEGYFADAWVGANYRFRNDADQAALLGFSEVQLAERQAEGDKMMHGKSVVAGFTTYKTYDPVVLSLTGAVQLSAKRQQSGDSVRPGASVSLSPLVGFAVNDKVTLSTGLNWRMQQANTRNGEADGIRRTSTSLDLGLGYALGKQDTLDLSVRPKVSGEGDVQVIANWMHRLEK